MAVPWTSPIPATVKGIIHVPAHNTPIKATRRDALLIAIAKARKWIDDFTAIRATQGQGVMPGTDWSCATDTTGIAGIPACRAE